MTETVLVVGAGTMGRGIAQVCATARHNVVLVDADDEAVRDAPRAILDSLRHLASKGRLEEEPEAILGRIERKALARGDLPRDTGASIGIEAVFEDVAVKREVLSRMEAACDPDALLATNTSGIRIARLAGALQAPHRLVGLHFFNPAPRMAVVEVVRAEATSEETFERAVRFVRSLGKNPLLVRKDIPGFVLNRIAMAASNEAIRLVQDGVATAEEIDRGVKGAFGWRMGPLETADLVGLDVVLAARRQIHEATGDPRFEPPVLLHRMVAQGWLGRKSGRGFYRYED